MSEDQLAEPFTLFELKLSDLLIDCSFVHLAYFAFL